MDMEDPPEFHGLDAGERVEATLLRAPMRGFSLDGAFAKDSLIVTNRRVYYHGTVHAGQAGFPGRHKARMAMPLDRITHFGVLDRRDPAWLVLAALLVVPGAALLPLPFSPPPLGAVLLGLGLASMAVFFLATKRVFVVSSPTATFEIPFHAYGGERIREFTAQLAAAMSGAKRVEVTASGEQTAAPEAPLRA